MNTWESVVFKKTLFDTILDVHMTTTGSLMRSSGDQNKDIQFLKDKLENWAESNIEEFKAFDNAVKRLIIVTLEESKTMI